VGNRPSAIKIARRKHTWLQKHADGFSRIVAQIDLKIEVHTLAVVAAVLVVVDVCAKRDVLAIWDAAGVRTSGQRLSFSPALRARNNSESCTHRSSPAKGGRSTVSHTGDFARIPLRCEWPNARDRRGGPCFFSEVCLHCGCIATNLSALPGRNSNSALFHVHGVEQAICDLFKGFDLSGGRPSRRIRSISWVSRKTRGPERTTRMFLRCACFFRVHGESPPRIFPASGNAKSVGVILILSLPCTLICHSILKYASRVKRMV